MDEIDGECCGERILALSPQRFHGYLDFVVDSNEEVPTYPQEGDDDEEEEEEEEVEEASKRATRSRKRLKRSKQRNNSLSDEESDAENQPFNHAAFLFEEAATKKNPVLWILQLKFCSFLQLGRCVEL